MKKQITALKLLLAVALVATLAGCMTPYTTEAKGFTGYLAYEGTQAKWPTSSSALTEVDFSIPVYLGPPARSYHVVGFVVGNEPISDDAKVPAWLWSDETRLGNACNQARTHGADALLLSRDPVFVSLLKPEPGHNLQSYRLLTNFDGVIVAIKWTNRR